MLRFVKTWPIMAALAGMIAFATPPPAQATFSLRVQSVGTGFDVTRSVASGTTGHVQYATDFGDAAVPNFSTVDAIGKSLPALTPPTLLDLFNLSVASAGGGHLILTLSDQNYNVASPGILNVLTLFGGTLTGAGSSLTVTSFADPGNGTPTSPSGSQVSTTHTFAAGAISGNLSLNFTATGAYALWIVADITLGAGGQLTSFDATDTVAPAPGGATLALCGLPFLGIVYVRRWRQKSAGLASAPSA